MLLAWLPTSTFVLSVLQYKLRHVCEVIELYLSNAEGSLASVQGLDVDSSCVSPQNGKGQRSPVTDPVWPRGFQEV